MRLSAMLAGRIELALAYSLAVPDEIEAEPLIEPAPVTVQATPAEAPAPAGPPVPPMEPATPGVRRSTRTRVQAKPAYEPSFTGKKYEAAATQLDYPDVLHPDAHLLFSQLTEEVQPEAVAVIMTQLSLRAGLKKWGKEAEAAAKGEMKQLHMRNNFQPVHLKDLTEKEKASILESHMFLKQKRDDSIKGRTVAGGNKQKDFISKEDSSSPTVATESVLLTCAIDAQEGRDVAVVDIPNAFIQTKAELPEHQVLLRLRGMLADFLVDMFPETYKEYRFQDKKGVSNLIVRCLNAIYGTVIASLLFYRKFRGTLEANGFEVNPYDPCVANRDVDGKQQTAVWHVDDCKLSCVNVKVQDEFIEVLRQEYESIFEDGSGKMTVQRGKKLKYLGMNLDFSTPGICKITMPEYIAEILQAWQSVAPEEKGTKDSATPKDLFAIDEKCEKLHSGQKEKFHRIVAKILFATKRARPDTGTAMSYLTTRVREPDRNDWRKLSHLMQYIRATKDLPLILGADGTGILKWYVDGSYTVHPNMRGHTGGGLTLGRGFPISASTKQKMNTRSSTESELVAVHDLMPSILWTRYFLEEQGYAVNENLILQDNISAMLLEKNGKASSSKRTKHINIRFFFVTDMVRKGKVTPTRCPTTEMIGDFWTRPTQGSLFRKHRDLIMGVEPK